MFSKVSRTTKELQLPYFGCRNSTVFFLYAHNELAPKLWCQTVQVHQNIGQAILHVPTVVQIIMACCYYNFCFLSFLRRLQIRLSRLRLLDEPKVKINKSVVTDFPPSNPLSSASELITKWDTFLKLNWGFSPFFIFLILISVHC